MLYPTISASLLSVLPLLSHQQKTSKGKVATTATTTTSRCEFERVDGSRLTWKEFYAHYFEKKPVVLTHLLDDWPAYSERLWTLDNIVARYGDYVFQHSDISGNNCRIDPSRCENVKLADQLKSSSNVSWFLTNPSNNLTRDTMARREWRTPSILRPVTKGGPFISVGGRMQGNIWHEHENNWLSQVHGRKRWLIYPPGTVLMKDEGYFRQYMSSACDPPPAWPNMIGCIVEAGEIMYLPSKWGHETCGMDEFNIGIGYIGTTLDEVTKHISKSSEAKLAARLNDTEFLVSVNKRVLKDPQLPILAAEGGHVEVMKLLFDRGVRKSEFSEPFIRAAKNGHVPVMEFLLKSAADVVDARSQDHKALNLAAGQGRYDATKYLLEIEKDIHASMRTQLVNYAAKYGHVNIVQLLQERLLTKEARKSMADSLYEVGCMRGHLPLAEYAVRSGAAKRIDLHLAQNAAREGYTHILKFLHRHGANWKTLGSRGPNPPLHVGAESGHVAAVNALLQGRADPQQMDDKVWQPIHYAVASGHAVLTDSFASLGQHVVDSFANDGKWAPVHASAHLGFDHVMEVLIKRRATLDLRNTHSDTPMDLAKKHGHSSIVSLLTKATIPVLADPADHGGKEHICSWDENDDGNMSDMHQENANEDGNDDGVEAQAEAMHVQRAETPDLEEESDEFDEDHVEYSSHFDESTFDVERLCPEELVIPPNGKVSGFLLNASHLKLRRQTLTIRICEKRSNAAGGLLAIEGLLEAVGGPGGLRAQNLNVLDEEIVSLLGRDVVDEQLFPVGQKALRILQPKDKAPNVHHDRNIQPRMYASVLTYMNDEVDGLEGGHTLFPTLAVHGRSLDVRQQWLKDFFHEQFDEDLSVTHTDTGLIERTGRHMQITDEMCPRRRDTDLSKENYFAMKPRLGLSLIIFHMVGKRKGPFKPELGEHWHAGCGHNSTKIIHLRFANLNYHLTLK